MDLSPHTSAWMLLQSTSLLLGRADLNLLSVGAVLLRSRSDGTILLIVHRLGAPLCGTEELIHRLECHTLFKLAMIEKVKDEDELTLVSGTRNQTNTNMEKQKQEKAMNAPYPPSPMVVSMLGTARAMTRLKSH
jgi:hypothetical protein